MQDNDIDGSGKAASAVVTAPQTVAEVQSEVKRQLAEGLARYMDTKAFVAKKVGKEQAERLKVRRSIAIERARAAIRFFEKPENFARLEARVDRAAATSARQGETK